MTNETEHVEIEVPHLTTDRLLALRDLIPEAFSEGRVDFDKLRAALGDVVDERPERYSFTWAGKRDAIRLLQTPSAATLVPAPEESVNWDTTQHLFIEGDNLEVLKLLYKAYFGRVKLIYIDPPYNTGNDFVYPDDFTDPLGRYLAITGQRDAAGNMLTSNPETSGRYHSAWLSMMYPRLFLARQLLREDGAIFISIDDNEVDNLRKLCNEIFGEENFIACIIWHKMDGPKNSAVHFSTDHDYILVYARDSQIWRPNGLPRTEEMVARYKNPDNDPRGPWLLSDLAARNYYGQGRYSITTPTGKVISGPPAGSYWRVNKEKFDELDRDNRIWWGQSGDNRPGIKRFLSEVREGVVPQTYWSWKEVGSTRNAKQELSELMEAGSGEDLFITPKPTKLMQRILQIATKADQSDIVLDFFAGSGATYHAVLAGNNREEGNRVCIMVQLPEPVSANTNPAQNTIADLTKERSRRAIKKLANVDTKQPALTATFIVDLGFRVFKLAPSTIRAWRGTAAPTPDEYVAQMALLSEPLRDGWRAEDVVWEVAIKEGFPLTSRVTTAAAAGQLVYRVEDPDSGRAFHICLDDTVTSDVAAALGLGAGDLLVVRDAAVDDTTAANLALQCRLKTL